MLQSSVDIRKEQESRGKSHYRLLTVQAIDGGVASGVEGHAGGTGTDTNTRVERSAVWA